LRLEARSVLLAVFALAWFAALWMRPLYRADESRYAEISREMVASGDWVTPRLNAFKYFEKPPLQYWATAAAFELVGPRDWAARLWTGLTGFCGVLLALGLARRLHGPGAGMAAAAALAASPLYVLLGQLSTLDMAFSLFLTAAVFAFALGHMLVFWGACALAVLSKGLAGAVLPFGAIALYVLLKQDWPLLRRMRWIKGGALFLAITAPWFIAVSVANGEFARFFFIREHFERFTTTIHQRYEPWWYFAAVLAVGMGPVLFPVVAGWYQALRERGAKFDPLFFLGLWASVVVLFFSVSSSKLPAYILPAFPALAVLAAGALHARWLLVQAGVLLACGVVLALWGVRSEAYGPYAIGAGACLLAGSAFAARLAWKGDARAALVCIAVAAFPATELGIAGHATMSDRFSVATTVAALPEPLPRDAQVFALDAYDHTMPWVLKRTVTMVGGKDELEPSIGWEPGKFIADRAAFVAAWKAAPQAYAFMDADRYDRRRDEYGVPMQLLVRGPRYVIVKKP
jgi:4-amino-4-deoxy-L-arabinose transferase-like glycosyltransferase